jgi:predicted ATP-dependent endonuclease of OLD family
MSGTTTELDQLAQRFRERGWNSLDNQDQTIIIILQLANIDINDFLQKGQSPEGRTLRAFDKRQASAYLTQQFAKLWKQKEVRFDIEIDATTLNIFVEDIGLGMPVRLRRRSTGFRWYVSFAWKFTHATKGDYKNCILLLEEPGIHLHHAGHRDLLELFEQLAADNNTVIYTTHLSTMLDLGYPERIRIVEVRDHHSRVINGMVSSQQKPMMVIEASLGLTGEMSGLLGNRQTLIVEGGDDALILQKLSGVLKRAGREGLSDRIYPMPADGASKTPMYAGFLVGQGWDAAVLLDSDGAGEEARKKIKRLYLDHLGRGAKFRVFMLGQAAGIIQNESSIEDIFPRDFYLDCVNSAYRTAILEADLPVDGSPLICDRVEQVLQQKHGRAELDKGLVMKELLKRFDSWDDVGKLPAGLADRAEKLFKAINAGFK